MHDQGLTHTGINAHIAFRKLLTVYQQHLLINISILKGRMKIPQLDKSQVLFNEAVREKIATTSIN